MEIKKIVSLQGPQIRFIILIKNNKSYVVREITFSPDSCKLAVSQSDNIVFVYRLGLNWDDEKKICNKFEQNTQVTTLIWPLNRPNELFFGIAEGKVKYA